MKINLFLLLFIFLIPCKSFSGKSDSINYQIFTLIYSQKFDEAEKKLVECRESMDTFYYNILNLDLYWWRYSMSRSRKDAVNLKNALMDLESKETNSAEANIYRLIQLSYRFRYEVKRYNVIGAILLRSDIREQINKVETEGIPFSDYRVKLFELYLALFEFTDNTLNPFMINSKAEACKKSISVITRYTIDDDFMVQTLAHYFLGRIYMKVEKDKLKAKEQFLFLSRQFPENQYFKELSDNL